MEIRTWLTFCYMYVFFTPPDMYTPLLAACNSSNEETVSACVALLLGVGANPNAHER